MKISSSWRVALMVICFVGVAIGFGGQSQPRVQDPVTVATGGSSADSAVMDPDVATDGKTAYVAYVEKFDVNVRTSADGKNFSNPVNVSNSAEASVQPSIAAAENGIVCVAWMEGSPAEIFAALSKDGGASFSKPVNVSNNESESGISLLNAFDGDSWDGSLSVTCDAKGNVYVAWADDQKMLFSSSADMGATFSAPTEVPNGGTEIRYPDLTTDGTTLYLVWGNAAAANSDIYFTKSSDAGKTWKEPINVTNNSGFSDAPSVAVDGKTITVCNDDTTGTNNADIFCATSTDGGDTFGPSAAAATDGGFVDAAAVPGKGVAITFDSIPGGRSQGPALVVTGTRIELPALGRQFGVRAQGSINISRNRVEVREGGRLVDIVVTVRTSTGTAVIFICVTIQ
jgi:hypothetical protein